MYDRMSYAHILSPLFSPTHFAPGTLLPTPGTPSGHPPDPPLHARPTDISLIIDYLSIVYTLAHTDAPRPRHPAVGPLQELQLGGTAVLLRSFLQTGSAKGQSGGGVEGREVNYTVYCIVRWESGARLGGFLQSGIKGAGIGVEGHELNHLRLLQVPFSSGGRAHTRTRARHVYVHTSCTALSYDLPPAPPSGASSGDGMAHTHKPRARTHVVVPVVQHFGTHVSTRVV